MRWHGAAALAVGWVFCGSTGVRGSELFSESVYVPPLPIYDAAAVTGWNGFSILVSPGGILPAQSTNVADDPFSVNGTSTITIGGYTPLATDAGSWVGPGPVTIAGLTEIHFTGTAPINQSAIPDQGTANPPDEVQFGITGPTDNSTVQILAQHWDGRYGQPVLPAVAGTFGYLRATPVVSVTPHPAAPPAGTSFEYIIDFLEFTQDGIGGTEWAEFPFVPGSQPWFTYSGWADAADPIHFTMVETQVSATEIPLEDLNYAGDPPSGGLFTPQALPADVVPEPGSLGLLALGAAGLWGARG